MSGCVPRREFDPPTAEEHPDEEIRESGGRGSDGRTSEQEGGREEGTGGGTEGNRDGEIYLPR